MISFFHLSPTSSHLHPLQVENCDSNSRLVVDEMTMVNSGLKGLSHSFWEQDLQKFGLTLMVTVAEVVSSYRNPQLQVSDN